ncbi:MAG: CcmD family protein [Acidobacteria bacterium]|nr:CcmD family protein [Acidobacteriota bacterium]
MEYLFAAYTAVWIALFIYLFSLSRRERKLRKMVERLEEWKTGRMEG